MIVPEQNHTFDQRLVCRQHFLDPPVLELAALLLDRPHDLELPAVDAVLALRFGRLLLAANFGRSQVQPFRRRRPGRAPDIAEQTIDGGGVVELLEGVDLGRRGAERCARQQMPRFVEVHRCGGASWRCRPKAGGKRGNAAYEATTTEREGHAMPPATGADALPLARAHAAAPAACLRSGRRRSRTCARAGRAAVSAPTPPACADFP